MSRNEIVKDYCRYRVVRVFHNDTEYNEHDEKYIRQVCVVKLQVRRWFLFRYWWITIKEWESDLYDMDTRIFFEKEAIEIAQWLMYPHRIYTNYYKDGKWTDLLVDIKKGDYTKYYDCCREKS